MVKTGTLKRAKLQLIHHRQRTINSQCFYRLDALPVAYPIDQSTEGILPQVNLFTQDGASKQ